MPRLLAAAALLAALAFPAAHSQPAPDDVTVERGVEYSKAGGESLQLNLARPKAGAGPFPAVVCIHGGGFRAGKRESYDALTAKLAQRGYIAATVSYRLAPKHQFPAAVHDVKAAVRWVRANAAKLRIDPDRIGVTGGSAGGHLAQFLGVTGDVKEFEGDGSNPGVSSRVKCVVPCTARVTSPRATAGAWTPSRCCRCSWAGTWTRPAPRTSAVVRSTG